jgi:hypothetical protein
VTDALLADCLYDAFSPLIELPHSEGISMATDAGEVFLGAMLHERSVSSA